MRQVDETPVINASRMEPVSLEIHSTAHVEVVLLRSSCAFLEAILSIL